MISKELAQEVVGYIGGIFSVEVDDFNGDILIYDNATERRRFNRYELAHKCKEWAYIKHNRYLKSYPTKSYDGEITYVCEILAQSRMHIGTFPGMESEPEAIFKACEWIRTQNATNN